MWQNTCLYRWANLTQSQLENARKHKQVLRWIKYNECGLNKSKIPMMMMVSSTMRLGFSDKSRSDRTIISMEKGNYYSSSFIIIASSDASATHNINEKKLSVACNYTLCNVVLWNVDFLVISVTCFRHLCLTEKAVHWALMISLIVGFN